MFKVLDFVYYEHDNNDYVLKHKHGYFECVFYLEGISSIGVGGEQLTVNSPSLVITSQNEEHDEKQLSPTKVYIVKFDDPNFEVKRYLFYKINQDEYNKYKNVFDNCYDLFKKNGQCSELNSLFKLFIEDVKRKSECSKIADSQIMVEKVKSYIKENVYRQINYKQLADIHAYSYSRFRHIFKEVSGKSLSRYTSDCKFNATKKLLATDMPIKQVMAQMGFSSLSAFDTFFKNKLGISPTDFREAIRNKKDSDVITIKNKYSKKGDK